MTESNGHNATETPAAEPSPAVPDYVTSPNAVFADKGVQWRYGKPPDYSKTRKFWEEGKKANHVAGSLEEIVENLVKNWEIEASFKPGLEDWRTIDHATYTFAMNGGPPQSAEHMLKVGTYNAIIEPNEYYDPNYSDFASSHKTFKRMMPTFAWEVLEVYSGPPVVSFKWRHWGVMKNDYVGFNNKAEKVTVKAHGGPIEIFGVTIAKVDDKVRVQSLDTWMDPLAMFRQIAPYGVVNKEPMNHKVDKSDSLGLAPNHDGVKSAAENNGDHGGPAVSPLTAPNIPKHISSSTGQPADAPMQPIVGCPFILQNGTNATSPLPQDHPSLVPAGEANSTATGRHVKIVQDVAETLSGHPSQTSVDSAAQQRTHMDIDGVGSNVNSTPCVDGTVVAGVSSVDTTQGAEEPLAMVIDEPTAKRPAEEDVPRSIYSSAVTGNVEDVVKVARSEGYVDESVATGTYDAVDQHLENSADVEHPHPKTMEEMVKPDAGEAVAVPPNTEETRKTVEEMSDIKPEEKELIMNRE